jgi:hypothetical protein
MRKLRVDPEHQLKKYRRELAEAREQLAEALEQQTATAEVLQAINSSPGALAPVFEAMLEKSMHLCEAAFGGLWMFEGHRYVAVALRGVPQAYAAFVAKTTVVPGPGTAPYRLMHGERLVHNIDLASEEPYRAGDPQRRIVDIGGARTALQVALRKEDAVLGIITLYRQEVRPFSDKHWCRISPPRPSSPSRTHACSTSCANRCSSKARPRRFCRSSLAHPAT